MKPFLLLLALLSLIALATTTAQSQFVIGSYERTQPFLFCGDTPISEMFTAPFSYTNLGTDVITVDSMIASGDTSDFNAHYNAQTASFYLNPLALNTVVKPKSVSIGGIGFQPTTLGDKQLIITAYYRFNTC